MNTGHKRSLTSVMKLLESEGMNIEALQQSINEIIVKTIITGQPLLSHLYNLSQPENFGNDMCFQLLGFDVLLEHDGSPKLLEVNHTPSFVTDTPLDEAIKGSLIRDTLQLMNITTERKHVKVAIGRER
jgi:tubulin polyglutamylase TTLL6/13